MLKKKVLNSPMKRREENIIMNCLADYNLLVSTRERERKKKKKETRN